jgi:type II restriction enzyme
MIKGNKGEWSEYYTFLKLLADGKIYAADENLNKNDNLFYLILKILRGKEEDLEYVRNDKIIIQKSDGTILAQISVSGLMDLSKKFYYGIKQGKKAFALDFAEKVFDELHTSSLSDERKETADIRIVIHDPITQYEPLLGFSIKSYIGGKPTLFNASKNSNLIFRILPDLSHSQLIELNKMNSYGDRFKWLKSGGFKLVFCKLQSEIFKTNLELIDSLMPKIVSEIVLCKSFEEINKLSEITTYLTRINPCDFNVKLNPNFYEYKIKRLLVDAALGMKAGKLWTGTFSATGGYIAVKQDGELLCYHIYNWNDFQRYLLNHTKIDFPDSSPNRCDFGRIISADKVEGYSNGSFIKINFQIRFL